MRACNLATPYLGAARVIDATLHARLTRCQTMTPWSHLLRGRTEAGAVV